MKTLTQETRLKLSICLTVIGGIAIAALSTIGVLYTLSTTGKSILEDIIISSILRDFYGTQIFTGLSSAASALTASYILSKKHPKAGLALNTVAAGLAIFTLINPQRYDSPLPTVAVVGGIGGVTLISAGIVLALTLPRLEVPKKPLLRGFEIIETAIFSMFYVIAALLIPSPSPMGGYMHLGDAILLFAALLAGSRVGFLVGASGSLLAGILTATPRLYIAVLAYGLEGVVSGLAAGKQLAVQALACVAGGLLMASTYFVFDIFLRGYPYASSAFIQNFFVRSGISLMIAVIASGIIKNFRRNHE